MGEADAPPSRTGLVVEVEVMVRLTVRMARVPDEERDDQGGRDDIQHQARPARGDGRDGQPAFANMTADPGSAAGDVSDDEGGERPGTARDQPDQGKDQRDCRETPGATRPVGIGGGMGCRRIDHSDVDSSPIRRSSLARNAAWQAGHSAAITEYIAESRSMPSSPSTHDRDQLRSTPSKRAPSASIARRDCALRASVFRSTRATPNCSKAYVSRSSFDSTLIPVR